MITYLARGEGRMVMKLKFSWLLLIDFQLSLLVVSFALYTQKKKNIAEGLCRKIIALTKNNNNNNRQKTKVVKINFVFHSPFYLIGTILNSHSLNFF